MTKKNKVEVTKVDFTKMSSQEIFDHFGGEMKRGNVSFVIRTLHSEGFTTGNISKLLGKRYQHVRNVLTQPLKKGE